MDISATGIWTSGLLSPSLFDPVSCSCLLGFHKLEVRETTPDGSGQQTLQLWVWCHGHEQRL
jgi:hypothetical protein